MNKRVLMLIGVSCLLSWIGVAWGDAIPFSYSGPGVAVTGTMYGSSNGDGSWNITGIDATYNQVKVAGIEPLSTSTYFLYNNLYYGVAHSAYAVDYYGIVFDVPGVGQVNLCTYTAAGGCGSGGYASILWGGGQYQFTQVESAKFGPAIPEPGTLMLLGGGMLAAGVAARRRLSR